MKKYLNFRFVFVFCMVLSLILAHPLAVFADEKDLMISTDSNALMTLELDDSDYLMMSPRSSVANVTNTINWEGARVRLVVSDNIYANNIYLSIKDFDSNGASFKYSLDGTAYDDPKYSIVSFGVQLNDANIPYPSTYYFNWDVSSEFSYTVEDAWLWSRKEINNAQSDPLVVSLNDYVIESSGDFAVINYGMHLTSVSRLMPYYFISYDDHLRSIDVTTSISFVPADGDFPSTAGGSFSDSEYQSDVSSSLSDLSSSVSDMTSEISGVTSAIEALAGAMEPHYNNVLTQLHHITEQLHAFWDQQFNLHHVPLMAKLSDIVDAIGNMDLEVEVNLNSLKTSIDNMSQAIQNKLQSVQDTLTNGFNNSGINQDAAELDQSLQEYEEAEKTVLDQVNGSLNDFEFDSGFDEYTNTIKVFSDFIQALYEASGGFKVVINLSLMLSIAGIVIGVYRFKDGG